MKGLKLQQIVNACRNEMKLKVKPSWLATADDDFIGTWTIRRNIWKIIEGHPVHPIHNKVANE